MLCTYVFLSPMASLMNKPSLKINKYYIYYNGFTDFDHTSEEGMNLVT